MGLLYVLVARSLWGALPRGDLWLIVFADDVALAMRNALRGLRVVRRALGVVGIATGLRLNSRKSGAVNYTRRPHMVVHDIASDGNGVPACGVGKYLRGWQVPVRAKLPARAAYVRSLGLHSCGILLAYIAYAVSVVHCIAQLFPP